MADLDYRVDVDTGSAVAELNRLNDRINSLQKTTANVNSSLEGFKNVLIGIGAAVAGASLFKLVDDLQNMENKLRIASESQDQFNQSLSVVKAIADATGQSMNAIGSLYAKVAVNAKNLGFTQDQVAATTEAFALALKVSGASAEGARSSIYQFTQILAKGKVNGDEFTTIMENLGGPVMDLVASKLGVTTAELMKLKEEGKLTAQQFSAALIASLDELNKMSEKTGLTIGQALTKIQNSFVNFLINLEQSTGIFAKVAQAMEWLANNARFVAIAVGAMAGAWIASRIFSWAAVAIEAGIALGRLITVFRTLGIAAAASEALATGGLSAITAAAGAAAAAVAANAVFDKIEEGSKRTVVDLNQINQAAVNSLTLPQLDPTTEKLKRFRTEIANIGAEFKKANLDTINTINLQSQLVGQSKLVQDIETARNALYKKSRDEIDKLVLKRAQLTDEERKENNGERVKLINSQIEAIKALTKEQDKSLISAISAANQVKIADDIMVASRQRIYDITKQLNDMKFEGATMGMTALSKQLMSIGKSAQEWADTTIQGLANAQNISVEAFKNLYPEQVAKVYKAASQGLAELTAQARLNNAEAERISQVTAGIERQISLNRQLADLYDEQAKMGLSGIEQKFYDIDAASRNWAAQQIDSLNKARFSVDELAKGYSVLASGALGGDPMAVQKILDNAVRNTERIKSVTEQNYRAARTFSSGWAKAFREYADNATNAAQTAQRIFSKTFQGIEDLIVDFVKTGKFNFKEFLQDIGEELLRSQVRSLLANLGQSLGIGGLFGGGGAQNGQGATATNPLFVSIVGGGGAFSNPAGGFAGMLGNTFGQGGQSLISGGGFGGAINQGLGGLGGIVNTVSSVFNTVKSVGSGIWDTVTSIGSGISDFFSGFFADGGTIPKGKFGVVGERGPEFVSGPAKVTPMPSGTNVTYNINAVDAMSFKQMIARDPSFIHAVALQGAKGTPGRY